LEVYLADDREESEQNTAQYVDKGYVGKHFEKNNHSVDKVYEGKGERGKEKGKEKKGEREKQRKRSGLHKEKDDRMFVGGLLSGWGRREQMKKEKGERKSEKRSEKKSEL